MPVFIAFYFIYLFSVGMEQLQSNPGLFSSVKPPRVLQPITNRKIFNSEEPSPPSENTYSDVFVVSNIKPVLPPIQSENNKIPIPISSPPKQPPSARRQSGTVWGVEGDPKQELRQASSPSKDYIGPAPSSFYTSREYQDVDTMHKQLPGKGIYKANPPCFVLGLFAGVMGLLTLVGGIIMTVIGYFSDNKEKALQINGIVFIILGVLLIFVAYLYFCVVVSRHWKILKKQKEKKEQNENRRPRTDSQMAKSRDEIHAINRMFRVKTYTRNDVWARS